MDHTARQQIVQGIGSYARRCHRWQPMIPWADLEEQFLPEGMKAATASCAMKWLKGLEAPFGVVAATDRTGFDLLNALRRWFGGDNVLYPFRDPTLSSVDLLGMGDVLADVPLSRRPLELRFKSDAGRTVEKEIQRVRLEREKEMLIKTDRPVAEIAEIAGRCGFSEPQRMTELFLAVNCGVAPGAFRQGQRVSKG